MICGKVRLCPCRQLLPEQRQVEAIDNAVCVEVGGLPLGLCQGFLAQDVALEKNGVGGGEGVVGVEVAGENIICFYSSYIRCYCIVSVATFHLIVICCCRFQIIICYCDAFTICAFTYQFPIFFIGTSIDFTFINIIAVKLSITLDTLTARILKLSSDSHSRIVPAPLYSWWKPADC